MIQIRAAADQRDQALAFAIRREVFIEEQGVPAALEFDASDARARHLLLVEDGQTLGTLRIRKLEAGEVVKIERVAVRRAARRRGLGRRLMTVALDQAAADGARRVLLHAQVQAQPFYERLGFQPHGQVFEEDGILHIAMSRRTLAPGQSANSR